MQSKYAIVMMMMMVMWLPLLCFLSSVFKMLLPLNPMNIYMLVFCDFAGSIRAKRRSYDCKVKVRPLLAQLRLGVKTILMMTTDLKTSWRCSRCTTLIRLVLKIIKTMPSILKQDLKGRTAMMMMMMMMMMTDLARRIVYITINATCPRYAAYTRNALCK